MKNKIIVCCNDSSADKINKQVVGINKRIQTINKQLIAEQDKLLSLELKEEQRIKQAKKQVIEALGLIISEKENRIVDKNVIHEIVFKACKERLGDRLKEDAYKKAFEEVCNKYGNSNGTLESLKVIIEKEKNGIVAAAASAKKTTYSLCPEYNIVICTKFSELMNIELNTYDGLIVFCELKWNHEATGIKPNEFGGVSLVQQYIRHEKRLRIPVIFTSFVASKEMIEKRRPDAKIISTPALQHRFIQFTSLDSLLQAFESMEYMKSDKLLDYTIERYCDILGMLRQIKHEYESSSDGKRQEFKSQLKYAVKLEFNNDRKLLNKIEDDDCDIKQISVMLIDRLERSRSQLRNYCTVAGDYICDSSAEQVQILFLEDNSEDKSSNRFIEYIEKKNVERSLNGEVFLFQTPVVVPDAERFYSALKNNHFNVVICDIEIWKNNELVALGFDLLEDARKNQVSPTLYYMVTNVTRSLHSRLIGGFFDEIKDIRLKEDLFASDQSIDKFLYGIKEALQKAPDLSTLEEYCKQYLNLYDYVKKVRFYDEEVHFKIWIDYNGDYSIYKFNNYNELEIVVEEISCELIRHFLLECKNKCKRLEAMEWEEYDKVCEQMQEYIGRNTKLGNTRSKMVGKLGKEKLNSTDIKNIATRMFHRRFFLYLRLFVEHHNVLKKFFKKYPYLNKYSIEDIACRAISKEYKGRNGEDESHALQRPLHYQTGIDDSIQLTEEERKFVSSVKKMGSAAFDFTSDDIIQNLKFDY